MCGTIYFGTNVNRTTTQNEKIRFKKRNPESGIRKFVKCTVTVGYRFSSSHDVPVHDNVRLSRKILMAETHPLANFQWDICSSSSKKQQKAAAKKQRWMIGGEGGD